MASSVPHASLHLDSNFRSPGPKPPSASGSPSCARGRRVPRIRDWSFPGHAPEPSVCWAVHPWTAGGGLSPDARTPGCRWGQCSRGFWGQATRSGLPAGRVPWRPDPPGAAKWRPEPRPGPGVRAVTSHFLPTPLASGPRPKVCGVWAEKIRDGRFPSFSCRAGLGPARGQEWPGSPQPPPPQTWDP